MATRLATYDIETGDRPLRSTRDPRANRQERSQRTTFRRLLRDLEALKATGGRLLEMGTGLGYFLDEARPYFVQRCGVELSPAAAESAARLADVPVYRDIEAIQGKARFDCIVVRHVIEQAPEPLPFVEKLAALLAPGGTLVFAASRISSIRRQVMGRRWSPFKYRDDPAIFDSATLKRLFADAGFVRQKRLRHVDEYPLTEILAKLRLPTPAIARHLHVPLPGATVCYAARRHLEPWF
jgi:SAM-dependent methyltransferase